MKKVISVATTAAMTLSALAVPAVICAAEQEDVAIQQAAYAIEDAKIAQGTGSFDVVVRATRTGNVQAGSLDIVTELYYGGKFKANVTAVKSDVDGIKPSNDGNKVTIEGTGSVKKGDVVAVITVSIDEATPQNAVFSFKVKEAEGDFASLKDTEAFLFVTEKTADEASIVLKSNNAFVAKNEVEIPVTISGSYSTLVTKFAASNGAVIKEIKIADKFAMDENDSGKIYFETTKDGMGIGLLSNLSGKEITLDNEVVATIKVALPENVVSGQSFKVSTRFFDGSSLTDDHVTPDASKSSDADIIYVMKGDGDLDNKCTQFDCNNLLNHILKFDEGKSYLPEKWETEGTTELDEVAYTIKTLGIKALEKAALEALVSELDVPHTDEEVRLSAADGTEILRYVLAYDERQDENFLYSDYLAENAE